MTPKARTSKIKSSVTDSIATTVGNASFICCILKLDNETKFPSSVLPDAAVQNLYFSPY